MKKALCLFISLLLAFSLAAGCATTENTDTATPAPAVTTTPEATSVPSDFPTNPPIDWGNYEASDVGQDILPFDTVVATTKKLPLIGEVETFSAWWPMRASNYHTNYNEFENMKELENRTNVHIDYFHPAATEAASAFPLMIASQDYCDMIYYAGLYSGGGDKAIADEVYLRLNELIDKYAPNYSAIRNYTDDARKRTLTDEGNIWGFFNICMENMPGYMGLNIRQDFLDKIGYKGRPETIDDWDSMLGQLLDGIDETTYALAIPPTGITRWSAFISAWDVGSDWYQVDGVAKYGPIQPEFRNYVELMKNWYDKGYIRKDFYAVPMGDYNMEITWKEYSTGACGAVDGSNTFGDMLTMFTKNPDINCIASRQPVLNKGDETHIRFDQGTINPGNLNSEQLAITTSCKNPELLVSWVDYRYTYEGYLLLYYGIEGLTYRMTGPNHIQITKNIFEEAEKEGVSPMTIQGKYTASVLQCSVSDYTNGWCFLDPRYATEIKVWAQDKCDHNFPSINLRTAEEGSEFATIYSDIETYVNETIPKFIIGSLSMDKYDDFVNQIKQMGIERAIELKQLALDAYNSR